MNTGFVIAEYNPLHLGHEYHLRRTRELGADAVCIVMSGNFVQRGEPAVAEKHVRAAAAVASGANLVLELPLKYALSSARGFAFGGVSVAAATGLGGFLSFGSTSPYDAIRRAYEITSSLGEDELTEIMKRDGCAYPVAVREAVRLAGADAETLAVLDDANGVLALEYMRAADSVCPGMPAVRVERVGSAHDSAEESDFVSASFIRARVRAGEPFEKYVPRSCADILRSCGAFPSDASKADALLCARLFDLTPADFADVENVSGGLENKLYEAVRSCGSLDEAAFAVKSKRYTLARIRRALLCAALGVTKADAAAGVGYIRVLAADETGRLLLREMKTSAGLPVVSNLSEISGAGGAAGRDAELDYISGKLFDLCLPSPRGGNPEYDIPPVFV